jgi:hypothetical protein
MLSSSTFVTLKSAERPKARPSRLVGDAGKKASFRYSDLTSKSSRVNMGSLKYTKQEPKEVEPKVEIEAKPTLEETTKISLADSEASDDDIKVISKTKNDFRP